MAISIPRGRSDTVIQQIISALEGYQTNNPHSKIDLYRQNTVSVRVRIIDPSFVGQGKSQRSSTVWKFLDPLPEEVIADISTLLLLTPEESKTSFANFEFEDPSPSRF